MKYIQKKLKNPLIAVGVLFVTATLVLAAPPTTPYSANETLDPACAPGDTNCIVQLASGTDNLGNHTATGNILLNGHWLSNDGGNEGIFIEPAGKVGINTSTLGHNNAILEMITANNQGSIQFSQNYHDSDTAGTSIISQNAAASVFTPLEIAASKTILGMNGNVGIGTTTQSAKLHIFGSGAGTIESLTDNGDSSGSAKVTARAGTTTITNMIYGNNVAYSSTDAPNGYIFQTSTSSPIMFATNGVEKVRILSNGNMGIGTTSPSSKLHVLGGQITAERIDGADSTIHAKTNSGNVAQVALQNLSGGYFGLRAWSSSGSNSDFSIDDLTSNSRRLTISSSGNVGIGTASPGAILDVRGSEVWFSNNVSTMKFTNASNRNEIYFASGGSNDFSIRNMGGILSILDRPGTGATVLNITQGTGGIGGNVGIGTTTPSEKLEVSGYGKFTTSIKIPGAGSSSSGYYACIDSTTGEVYKGGSCSLSDIRLKKNIVSIDGNENLHKVLELQGVRFNWKDEGRGTNTNIGFIAQDVEKVFPEAITENLDGMKAMNYEFIIAPLVEAVKELYNKLTSNDEDIATLKRVIELQQEQIKSQQSQIDELKSRIN